VTSDVIVGFAIGLVVGVALGSILAFRWLSNRPG
jgi:ABC-type nitrate/sulfonate/bicarbonate transport system permease component